MQVRTLKESDFDSFLAFIADFSQVLEEQSCFVPDKSDWCRHIFDDPDFNEELFIGLFDGPDLLAAAFGVVRSWKDPGKGFIKFIFSSPSPEGQKFTTTSMLLNEIETRLFASGVTQIHFGSSSPLYFFPGLHEVDKKLYTLLISRGWHDSSERINRVIDMQNLRISQSDLLKQMQKVNCANFADSNTAELNKRARFSISIARPGESDELGEFIAGEFSQSWSYECLSACDESHPAFASIIRDRDRQIIGFAAINASNPNWFGPMGVKKSLRAKGLGKLLVLHSLLHLHEISPKTERVLLPWINDKERFYCSILCNMTKARYRKMVLFNR